MGVGADRDSPRGVGGGSGVATFAFSTHWPNRPVGRMSDLFLDGSGECEFEMRWEGIVSPLRGRSWVVLTNNDR